MKSTSKTFQYGEHKVTIETGAIARQADGAVLVDMAEVARIVGWLEATRGDDIQWCTTHITIILEI